MDYDFSELQKKTHFDAVELEAFHEQYRSLSTTEAEEGGINRETFERCLGPLGLEKNLITDRIFAFFDANGDGIIDFEELACGLSILCKGNLDERIKHAFKGYDLNNDGLISRSELHEMFRAYFHLSMELVRDVVKTMEEGMLESFDDDASKPVSAAFAAPIPPGGSTDEDDENGQGESSKGRVDLKTSAEGDIVGSSFGGSRKAKEPAGSASAGNTGSLSNRPRRSSSASLNSPSTSLATRTLRQRPNLPTTLRIDPLSTPEVPLTTSPTAVLAQSLPPPTPLTTISPFSASAPWSASGTPGPGLTSSTTSDYHYPVMEAMSQDAIEEMVDRTFEMAGIPKEREGMTEEEFAKVVEKDSNLLAWFEALGSVF
ncbi:hypothetical protein HDV00_000306 [Rhizophlyctis rosea]|nr:hypothetical protein HDV00_000306 [Rhizophlyctis rosea]